MTQRKPTSGDKGLEDIAQYVQKKQNGKSDDDEEEEEAGPELNLDLGKVLEAAKLLEPICVNHGDLECSLDLGKPNRNPILREPYPSTLPDLHGTNDGQPSSVTSNDILIPLTLMCRLGLRALEPSEPGLIEPELAPAASRAQEGPKPGSDS
ncbi:hypothetical protein BT96DRAFT_1001073 [Gymnopus androsaceus JB14]|uniref:Uncharacterized protein n=1 Tax=Gymnopus androsaceus JB14 TaxID=1447944 RepID=A0A6A4H0F2_9AGAR|nr:hypothetical protein BT96DRAFT_1001073 [Gymnopus androsaceus JB14]